jgi:hypothetical protein
MLAGVNFYIGAKTIRPNQVEVYANSRGIRVYSNPDAFPRVWTVHHMDSIAGEQDIPARLERPLAELRDRAFVVGQAPSLETCAAPDHIDLLSRRINSLTVAADMQCKGMVVVSETYYPGWEATVDGRPAPVLETYGFLRGVVVNAGRHRVEMHYRPKSVYWGAALTGIGLLAAALIGFSGLRRSEYFRGQSAGRCA